MSLFTLQLINGITLGMIYGLAALGFTMVYKAVGFLNFSHSNSITYGAFFTFILMKSLGFSIWTCIPVIAVFMFVFGFVLDKIIFSRFANVKPLTFMLVSISLSTVLTNISLIVFGPQPKALTNVFPNIRIAIKDVIVPFNNICIFLISIIFLVVLQLFFMKTKYGLALRLSSEDKSTASLMGINTNKTRTMTFALTAIIGGIAGLLISPLYSVTIELGSSQALKMFVAAVVGGLGDFVGAVIGGILVGIIESLSASFISSAYKDLIVYVVGIIVLTFFPYGLFRNLKKKF